MAIGVYRIRNIVNQKVYIGSTASVKGFPKRWYRHLKDLRSNTHFNPHLQHAWNKYGEKCFVFEILEECFPDKCKMREQVYLDSSLVKYNIAKRASSAYKTSKSKMNHEVTDETRSKISDSLKGRKLSAYHKTKISDGLRGKKKSKSHILKVRNVLWGASGIMRRRPAGRFLGSRTFYNTKTKESVTCGMFEFADRYNIDRSYVYKMCNGKVKSCKGWIFKERK